MAREAFLSDTFTEAGDTALTSHTPDVGGAWALQTGFATGLTVVGTEDRVQGDSGASTSIARNAATPTSANYSVKATLRHTSTTAPNEGVTARAAAAANTFYHWYYDGSALRLFRQVAGVGTALDGGTGTVVAIANNTDYTLELVVFDSGVVALYNDAILYTYHDQSPITDAGNAGLRSRSAGRVDTLLARYDDIADCSELVANGVWTWFSDPRAVYYNGSTYIGWVNKTGDIGVTKFVHATQSATSFTLAAAFEKDDHDNAAIYITPTGHIVCFYCEHNDASGSRYRRSTNPEDISAFDAEATLAPTGTATSYSVPIALNGRLYLFHRHRNGATIGYAYRRYSNAEISGGSWDADVSFYENGGAGTTPYILYRAGATGEVEIVCTDRHPVDGQSSIYHFRMVDTAGVVTWETTDGTAIVGALPHIASDFTLVSDGASVKRWIWDIQVDGSGLPQILGTRYPGNNGTSGSPAAIVYIHCRWNGSAWVEVDVANDDDGFYSPEVYYAGGLCFDTQDITKAYVSRPATQGQTRTIMEYGFNGTSWSKTRDVNPDSMVLSARPISPRGHNGELPLLYWEGVYDSYVGPGETSSSGSNRGYTTRILGEFTAAAGGIGTRKLTSSLTRSFTRSLLRSA